MGTTWSVSMKPWLPLRTSSRTKLQTIRIVQLSLGGERSRSRRGTTHAITNSSSQPAANYVALRGLRRLVQRSGADI